MDRRTFVTWITGAGATLTLPKSMRPTMQWKPAQEFWVSKRGDWILNGDQTLMVREEKELFVPCTSVHTPNFSYGSQWEKTWVRGMEPNFSLGDGQPEGSLTVNVSMVAR